MGNTKRCNTCKLTKSIRHFYVQKAGIQGRTGSCKICRGEYQKKYSELNREKRREAARKYRSSQPEKQKERHERFKEKNPDYWKEYYKQNRRKRLDANKRFYDNHPERRRFYKEYKAALRKGVLVRLYECSLCGVKGKTVGHHFNYSEPLKVTWMCQPCHLEVHRKHRFMNGN